MPRNAISVFVEISQIKSRLIQSEHNKDDANAADLKSGPLS
jgi:hypothetical protein